MPLQHFPHFSDFSTQGQNTKIQPKNTKDRRKRLPMSTICHTRKCSHAHPEQPTTRQKSTTKHTPTEKHLPSTSRTRHLPHSSDFSTQGQKTRFNQKTRKAVASACRCLPFVTRSSVPTRTLNYQQQAKKARQNTHRQKTPSVRSEPHERQSTEKDKLSPLSRNAICLSWSNKAKDDPRTTPEDVIARKTRETGGACPSCSGPGRPRTRVRSAKQFPRTARNSKQREG